MNRGAGARNHISFAASFVIACHIDRGAISNLLFEKFRAMQRPGSIRSRFISKHCIQRHAFAPFQHLRGVVLIRNVDRVETAADGVVSTTITE